MENFKCKDLRFFSDLEEIESGYKYQKVFLKKSTSFIYAEFSFYNKLFDKTNWDIECSMKVLDADNVCVAEIKTNS